MFNPFKFLFKRRKKTIACKENLISVKLDDGNEVPIVPNDRLILVKNHDGNFEIKIRGK